MTSDLRLSKAGNGKPLILIPGFASGAWTWFRQIEELSKDFQVITFDPRGIGQSKNDSTETPSMKLFVEDVLKVLDELKIERANVLGASFGGFVAQEFALAFPERVDKLILSCTTAGGINHVKPSAEILQSFAPDPTLTVSERIRKFIRPAFTKEFNVQHADEVEQICRLRETNAVADEIYFAQLQAALTFDTSARLSEIKNETLVVTGDKDDVVPMQNSENLAAKLPNAELQIIENGSHLIFVENAAEFNKIVKQFVLDHWSSVLGHSSIAR